MDIALRIDLKTNKYYFQDKNGIRREPDYDYARPFVEGFAAVKTNGKWFFLDQDFHLRGDGYDRVGDFSEGYGAVAEDGKWYFVDTLFKRHGEGYQIDNIEKPPFFFNNSAEVQIDGVETRINKKFEYFGNCLSLAKANPDRIKNFDCSIFQGGFDLQLKDVLNSYCQEKLRIDMVEWWTRDDLKALQQQMQETTAVIDEKKAEAKQRKKDFEEFEKIFDELFGKDKESV